MSSRRFGLVALLLAAAACGNGGSLEVSDGWSRPVPPVAPTAAIYMNLTNGLDDAVALVGASSAACDAIEIHQTAMSDDGVMAMTRPTGGFVVEAGVTERLEPGGAHLMCIEPSIDGELLVTLEFSGADPITVSAIVEDR